MASQRSRDALQKALKDIADSLHKQYPREQARLAQLDSHLATVAMLIDHIHNEAAKAAGE